MKKITQKILPEWAPQSGVMLTWPHKQGWTEFLDDAEKVFVEIVKVLTLYERALIIYYDQMHLAHIRLQLKNADIDMTKTLMVEAKSNDIWVRDNGPITIQEPSGKLKLLSFTFNAWGGKYVHNDDANLCSELHKKGTFGNIAMEFVDFVLEGGAIEVDGRATLLTTENVQLNKKRNNMERSDIETMLKRQLGVERVLWLKSGHLIGDDTDGHIDTLARFIDPETICYVSCTNPEDPHYSPLQAMEKELKSFKTEKQQPYRLIPLPLPDPQYSPTGERLPATYANFLMINGAILIPIYGVNQDNEVLNIFKKSLPKLHVHAINCRPLIHFYGSLHCATMQLPAGVF